MTRLKYLDPADGQYKLLPVGGGSGGPEEVTISPGAPSSPYTDLWVDTDAPAPVTDWSVADSRYLTSGFRNVIRNGDCSIGQRGNGPWTTTGYTADNWVLARIGGTVSAQRQATSAYGATKTGSPNYYQVSIAGQSAVSDYAHIELPVESVKTLNSTRVTLSFWAVADSGTYKIGVEVSQNFGSGGSPSTSVSVPAGSVSVSDTDWKRYSITFDLPSVEFKTTGTNNNDFICPILWLSAGSNSASRASNIGVQNWAVSITDVQLEAGTTPTPFERLPQQQQLAWCQRYYWRHDSAITGQGSWVGQALSATSAYVPIKYPVPMRTQPTINMLPAHFVIRTATGSGAGVNSFGTPVGQSIYGFTANVNTAGGHVAGNAADLLALNPGVLEASAEL